MTSSTSPSECLHEAKKLTFAKMFLNDNGSFGGQHVEILLDCECGATLFVHSYRGNVSEQYVRPNTIMPSFSGKEPDIIGKQQEIW